MVTANRIDGRIQWPPRKVCPDTGENDTVEFIVKKSILQEADMGFEEMVSSLELTEEEFSRSRKQRGVQ